jgi:dihydropteroate synthase
MEKNSDKVTGFSQKRIFEFNGKKMDFSRPVVMGILNLTPDSFYEASRTSPPVPLSLRRGGKGGRGVKGGEERVKVDQMLSEGASIIDIGAVSTRPGAAEVSAEEEKGRLTPVLIEIRKKYPEIIISIDTYRTEIAKMAAGEGADMINDISGGTFDTEMISTMINLNIPYVIMHIQGTPGNMQVNPVYKDVLEEVFSFLRQQAKLLEAGGHHKIILDPGFGFGKTVEHNYSLLNNLDRLTATGYPVLAGLSRKSMINRVLGTSPDEALNGTTVLNTIALLKGANILRVHDVKEAMEAIRLIDQLIWKFGNLEIR